MIILSINLIQYWYIGCDLIEQQCKSNAYRYVMICIEGLSFTGHWKGTHGYLGVRVRLHTWICIYIYIIWRILKWGYPQIIQFMRQFSYWSVRLLKDLPVKKKIGPYISTYGGCYDGYTHQLYYTTYYNDPQLWIMWVKQCHKPSLSLHHFYRWYVYHSQLWVVYDIVLSTIFNMYLGVYSYGHVYPFISYSWS